MGEDMAKGYLSLCSEGDERVSEHDYLEELFSFGLLDYESDPKHPMSKERASAIPDLFNSPNTDEPRFGNFRYGVCMLGNLRLGRREISLMCSIPLNTLNKIIDGARPVTVLQFSKLVEGYSSAIFPEGGTYLDRVYEKGDGKLPYRELIGGPETYKQYLIERIGRDYPESMGERRKIAAALLLGYRPDVEAFDPTEEDLQKEFRKTRLLMLCALLVDEVDRDDLLSAALAFLKGRADGDVPKGWRNSRGQIVTLAEYRERFNRVAQAFELEHKPRRLSEDGAESACFEIDEDDLDWLICNIPDDLRAMLKA